MFRNVFRAVAFCACIVSMAACSSSRQFTPGVTSSVPVRGTQSITAHRVCVLVSADSARCHAWQVDTQAITGYHPADLQAAYALPSTTAGAGQSVAIVDAYDDPSVEKDLRVYRSAFGLPPCTTANGCFKKVNQFGMRGMYPHADIGWAEEISLDVDMVSAICPNCRILLVEAKNASWSNIFTAVDTAARFGPDAISNSYGGTESAHVRQWSSHYDHPGMAITASSGDSGYGVEFPASSSFVTAVGGTSLLRASNTRGWSETAWDGAGAGCSAYIAKPAWQTDAACSNRTVADVSAVADPSTGVAVYDTYGDVGGWLVFGGTSVASPIVASTYALAANAASVTYGSYPYANSTSLFDVIGGNDGSCAATYLCTAVAGYDGPTGLGTPNGIAAF